MYDSWDIEHDRKNILSLGLGYFLPFYTPKNLEKQNFEKKKKKKNTYRYHFTQVHHTWQSQDIWFLRYEEHLTEFFCHLGLLGYFFVLLSPSLKNENFKKLKTKKGYEISPFYTSVPKIIIISYTISGIYHMTVYTCYFPFWASFHLLVKFLLPTAKKIRISKEWKKCLEISSFYMSAPKIITVPEISHMTENEKFKKNGKETKQGDIKISSSNTSVPKIIIICFTVPEIWRVTDVIAIFHFLFFIIKESCSPMLFPQRAGQIAR